MEKAKPKTEITILELLNWLIYDIPPTQNVKIHGELNDFIENHNKYDSEKTNLTFEKYCHIQAIYDDVINKILEGYLPLYAHKIYDPWALYLTNYKEENPKELVYQGTKEYYFPYNLMCHPIDFLLYHVTEQTQEQIKPEGYDVWKKSYIQYKKENKWKQLPAFELMKETAIVNNGCYTYDGIVVRLRDAQNTYYEISTFCNKIYKRTKEQEQKMSTKRKKEKRQENKQTEEKITKKTLNTKNKIRMLAEGFMKIYGYENYTRNDLANDIQTRLVSEGYKKLEITTIMSYLPAHITKNKRGRPVGNPVKHIKPEE